MTIIIISHETFFIFISPHCRLWTFAVTVHWSVQRKHFSEELTLRKPSVSVFTLTHNYCKRTNSWLQKACNQRDNCVHTPTSTHLRAHITAHRPITASSHFIKKEEKKRQLTEEVDWTSKNRRQGSVLPQFATPTHTPLAIIPRFISVRQSSTGNERRSLFQRWLIGIEMLHSSRQSIKSNWSESTGRSGKSTACGPS